MFRPLLRHLRAALLLTVALFSLPRIASAAVVYRHGGSISDALVARGGRIGYTAPVQVNGLAGTMTLIAFDEAPQTLVDRIKGNVDISAAGITTFLQDDKRVTVLVSPSGNGRTTLFLLSSELGAQSPPVTPPVAAMPHYPQSRITLSVTDQRANATLCVSEISGVGPDQVRYQLDNQLLSSGWSAAIPNTSTSLGMFFRNDETCLVFATNNDPAAPTRITVLHKSPGIE